MKFKITTFAFCTLLTPFAHADGFTEADQERCDMISSTAEKIMQGRQSGVAMSKHIEAVNDAYPEGQRALWHELVSMAHERPRFSSPEYRREAVTDFGNTVYQECYKTLTKE